jgi:amino acid permease
LPKSFVNGGYLVGVFMHIFAAIIEGTSAALLC